MVFGGEKQVTEEAVKILLVEDLPEVTQHIRNLLSSQRGIVVQEVATDGQSGLNRYHEWKPDVVMIDSLLQGKVPGLKLAEELRKIDPKCPIILLTVPQNPVSGKTAATYRVLSFPFGGGELVSAVKDVFGRMAVAMAENGVVITVFCPKGGVGRTTLAVNLAFALTLIKQKTILIDGCFQFGDIRTMIKPPPEAKSIVDLPQDKLDDAYMRQVVYSDTSGLDVLLAPPRVEEGEMISQSEVARLLDYYPLKYNFIVVDTPPSFSEPYLTILDKSDLILSVLTYDPLVIRNVLLSLEVFQEIGYPPEKLRFVLNRGRGGEEKEELEKELGVKIDFVIPYDEGTLFTAAVEASPVVLSHPDAPVSRGILAMADGLIQSKIRAGGSWSTD